MYVTQEQAPATVDEQDIALAVLDVRAKSEANLGKQGKQSQAKLYAFGSKSNPQESGDA